ncbi:MAG: hypothetical protein ACPHUE_05860, partial [Flavobacteriaceae bacterium]
IKMKKLFYLAVLCSGLIYSQDISWGDTFNADFVIDSAMTTDGLNWQIAASGDAGPYGKAYLSYSFTNYFSAAGQGEFTGFAWTQVGEKIVNGSLQGVWKKEGKVFKMYSLDNDATNGVFNIVSGEVDFVAKTMRFKVAPMKD